jgi:hypothetical protein
MMPSALDFSSAFLLRGDLLGTIDILSLARHQTCNCTKLFNKPSGLILADGNIS